MNNERKLKHLLVSEIELTNELLQFINSAFEAVCEDKQVLKTMKWKFKDNLEMIPYNGGLCVDFNYIKKDSIKHIKDLADYEEKKNKIEISMKDKCKRG